MFDQNQKRRQKGTGFTNIGKILGANVGAGQQMAGKIAQGIQTAGQKVQQNLGQAQQQFKGGFQQATQPALGAFQQAGGMIKRPDESEEDYSKRIAAGAKPPIQAEGQPGTAMGNQAGNQPNAPAVDYSEIGKKVQEAKYTGPKGLENASQLLGSAVSAAQMGGLTTSGEGQQELTKRFVAGRQGYTKGQGALDQMLLSQSPEAQRQFQQARESVSALPEDVLASARSAELQAQGMTKGFDKEKARILGGVQSSINELEERAKEKGQLYSRDASRLAELLKDKSKIGITTGDKGGTQFSEKQEAIDKKLLADMEKFGIGGGGTKIDFLNPEEFISGLQEIANKGTTGISSKYGDPQKAALQQLARFQQDEGKAANIAAMKDQTAFNLGGEDIKNLSTVKGIEAKKQTDRETIKDMPKLEQVANARGKVSHLDYMSMAEGVLGRDVVQAVRNKMDEENGRHDWFGASDEYIDSVTDGAIQSMIQQKLQPMYQAKGNLDKYQQNEMSLQDYINKMYGLG